MEENQEPEMEQEPQNEGLLRKSARVAIGAAGGLLLASEFTQEAGLTQTFSEYTLAGAVCTGVAAAALRIGAAMKK